jgi:hypothetical protein
MGNHPGYWAKNNQEYDRQNPSSRAPLDLPPIEYDPPTEEDIQAEAQYDRERSEFRDIVSRTDDATLREQLADSLERGVTKHFQIDFLSLLQENIVNRFIAELTPLAGNFRESLQPQSDRRLRNLRKEIAAGDPECEAVLSASASNNAPIEIWLKESLDRIESPMRNSRHEKEREIAQQKLDEVARRQKEEEERKRQEEEERKRGEEAERKQREEEQRKRNEEFERLQKLVEESRKLNAKLPNGKKLPLPWNSFLIAPTPLDDAYTTMTPGFLKQQQPPEIVNTFVIRQQPPEALDLSVRRKPEFDDLEFAKTIERQVRIIDRGRLPRPKYERPTVSAVDFIAELSGDTRVARWRAGQFALPSVAKLKLIDEELARRKASRSDIENFFRHLLGSIGLEC